MNCHDAMNLVHAYIDGELDLVKSLEIEQHLRACAACKVQYDRLRELGSGIRAHADFHRAPADLRARLAAAMPREPGAGARGWNGWGMAAALALCTMLGVGFGLNWFRPGAEERLAREVVAAHVRSLLPNHLMDIASSDQHTVKPWIAGKLDFSPPVEDLAAQGYALAGGRLDYLDGRGVMSLIYRRHAHVINLFVWPQALESGSGVRFESIQGYHLAQFSRNGMVFWAVSDLSPDEFRNFVGLLRAQVAGAS